MGVPQSAGSRTKGGTTAVAAFRRVIYNSQIHSETNRATQQVSHSFLCNPCNPDLAIFYWGFGSPAVSCVVCVSQTSYLLPAESLCCCVEPDSLPSSSESLCCVWSQLYNFLQVEPLCCVESQTQSLSSD